MAIKLLSSDTTPKENAALLMVEEEKRIVDMALLGSELRAYAAKKSRSQYLRIKPH